MKKQSLKIRFTLIFLLIGTMAFSQLKLTDLKEFMPPEGLTHPYLLFDEADKQDILKSVAADPELKELYDRLLMEAFRYLKMPVCEEIPQGGDLSRYYARKEMGRFIGQHIQASLNLAFAYQLTGEKKYADKAIQHAEMLCRLESWVYPFHEFQQIYDRVWPWNVGDDQVVFSYDLQSAQVANNLALVYDWIYPVMEKAQRDRIRGALLEKAITRVRGNFDYHWWASAFRCNWSGICYSGAGLASLALLTEDPKLTDVVIQAYNGVSSMLDELGPDGGWQEGRGYWFYGIGHSIWFMDAINQLSNGTYNLLQHKRLKNNPADFPLYTLSANFGDGRGGPVGSSWFFNKMVSETGNQAAAWYSKEFIRPGATLYDLIWPKPKIEGAEPAIKSKHFRGIDWAIMRSSFKPSPSFTIACKAGLNDDPHHGHLDCGHFMLEYNGKPIVKDMGSAKYDDFYFSAERWDYIEASSEGHNVVSVNGEVQVPAKLKDQDWKAGVGGEIEDFYTSDTMDRVRMTDLQNAYPGEEMSFWQREILLYKPSLVVVGDLVGSKKDAEIRSRLHPGSGVVINKGYYTIETQGEQIALVPFSNLELMIESGREGSLTVNEDVDFEWIRHVDCVVKSDSKLTFSGYIIFPLEEEGDAEKLIGSIDIKNAGNGDFTLSFDLAKKKYNLNFKQ